MIKNLIKPGYKVELKHDTQWRLFVTYQDRNQYYLVFKNKEEAVKRFNEMK